MPVDLVPPVQVWYCRSCSLRIQTKPQGRRTPLHDCSGHGGFKLPLLLDGAHTTLVIHERQDYVGREDVRRGADCTPPIMRADVVRPDGSNDAWVYAPTAHARGEV
jgi:hypothetical protein